MKWLMLFDENHLQGGFQSRMNQLAAELLERGDAIEFICFRKNPFEQLASDFPKRCKVRLGSIASTRSLRPASLRGAWTYLREVRPDAIFFCNTGVPNFLPFALLARLAGVKHAVAHFGTDVELPAPSHASCHFGGLVPGFGLWRKELIWSARLAFRRLTLALFNNDEQMAHWKSVMGLPSQKCALWDCPVDLSRFRPCEAERAAVRKELKIADDDFVIGGVGGLNRQKSFDLAIRALSEIRTEMPQARLVIAGDGILRGELESLTIELDLTERVQLLGRRSDVHRLMNAFDVFNLPSTHPNETLGIAYVEAQACGVPIVVPDLPGPRRVARDGRCGLIVPAGDHRALAQSWLRLSCDEGLRTSLREEALACSRENDRKTVIERLLAEMKGESRTQSSSALDMHRSLDCDEDSHRAFVSQEAKSASKRTKLTAIHLTNGKPDR